MTDSARELVTDRPITDANHDDLDRDPFAEAVAYRIACAAEGPSIVFGLAGEWGSGKTSLLNLIRGHLEASDGKPWKVVWFTPWAASDSSNLVAEFYATIASALTKKTRESVKNAMSTIISIGSPAAKVIPIVGDATAGVLGKAGDLLVKPKPFKMQFDAISSALAKEALRMLVIVDDLDRLQRDELATVLKSVRVLGAFPGIHYLLAYDHGSVCRTLSGSNADVGLHQQAARYLEKIIQYPFETPPLQQVHREREIVRAIAAIDIHFGAKGKLGLREPVGSVFLDIIPDRDLRTLRSIYRLVGQFDVALTTLGSAEVNFLDLLLVTFLRMNYRDLHSVLPRWKRELTQKPGTSVSARHGDKEIDWTGRITKVISAEDDAKAVRRLIGFLFPAAKEGVILTYRQPSFNMVCEPAYFDRYFTQIIPADDISDQTVLDWIESVANARSVDENAPLSQLLAGGDLRRVAVSKVEALLKESGAEFDHDSARALFHWVADTFVDSEYPEFLYGSTRLVASLFGLMLNGCNNADQARDDTGEMVDRYGLLLAHVLRRALILPGTSIKLSEDVEKAMTTHLQDAECNSAIIDLSTLDGGPPPESGSLLQYWSLIGESNRQHLRLRAQELMAKGASIVDIATRFVRVIDRRGERYDYTFYYDEFSSLIPDSNWGLDMADEITKPDLAANSYQTRRDFALWALHNYMRNKDVSSEDID